MNLFSDHQDHSLVGKTESGSLSVGHGTGIDGGMDVGHLGVGKETGSGVHSVAVGHVGWGEQVLKREHLVV